MRCPECGEASNARLKYCENCGAKMPDTPSQLTGSRPALRPSRPQRALEEPSYAAEILDEADDYSRGGSGGQPSYAPPPRAVEAGEDTDPGQSRPKYDGPKWLASVPGHSQSVVGLGILAFALALSILPSFDGVGVVATLATLVGAVLLVARELRQANEAEGLTGLVPEFLLRPEVTAAFCALLVALAIRMLGLGFTPVLWLVSVGLVVHDQYRKVLAGPEGVVARYFDPRQLLLVPEVVALGGVGLCILTLYAPWATVSTLPNTPENAPMPAGPPELRVIQTTRPPDDVLYSAGGGITTLSGWELPGAVVMELLLLTMLGLLALRPEVDRPAWTRFAPAGVTGVGLLWALLHMKLSPGPIIFVVGLGAVGFLAFQRLRAEQQAAAAPAYDDEGAYDETEQVPTPDADYVEDETEEVAPRRR
ncbi:zinc ribbon domain-containing protein [Myxococcus sp. K15C18031901]|uniref:zinc ribbon domain-containing protein n=1 Tax=Myxococcus dinghuensis TaxID=2906761 RepID=UPI0020A722AD|nr:zinc ribbon domain-containing protein [Myxococcus dinghuensis]MCP3103398.1 zinc ribbon domain-containing protein [Myxococcus dinghuensis]